MLPMTSPSAQALAPEKFGSGAQASRMDTLDAVRGIAILLVLGYHAYFRFASDASDPVAALLGSMGWIGVDVFFALSGFLIVSILARDARAGDMAGFFRRRFFRIVPIFMVAMAVYAVGSYATGIDVENFDRLWIPALFLNGWLIPVLGVSEVPFTITWSLSVEEFAYLALGLAALRSQGRLRAMVLAFVVVAFAVRLTVLATHWIPLDLLYYFVPARLDAIAFGGLGALGYYARFLSSHRATIVAGLATFGLMVAFHWAKAESWFLPAMGYSLFGLACGAWVTGLAGSAAPAGPLVRVLASIGRLSYFIYLFHMFFLEGLRLVQVPLFGRELPYWLALAIATTACYLVAQVSWRLLEAPLIQRGRRPLW